MIFSCTNKVVKELKSNKSISESKAELGFFNWYIDLLKLNRKTYFLFTNSKTLFSFIIYIGTKKEKIELESLFKKCLQEMIVREIGFHQKYIDLMDLNCQEFEFTTTNSRSILGSMNDFKLNIKHRVQKDGLTTETYNSINHYLNQMPMGLLNYATPLTKTKEEFKTIATNI